MTEAKTSPGPRSKTGKQLVKQGAEYLGYMGSRKRIEYFHVPAKTLNEPPFDEATLRANANWEIVAVRVRENKPQVVGLRFDERLVKALSK